MNLHSLSQQEVEIRRLRDEVADLTARLAEAGEKLMKMSALNLKLSERDNDSEIRISTLERERDTYKRVLGEAEAELKRDCPAQCGVNKYSSKRAALASIASLKQDLKA